MNRASFLRRALLAVGAVAVGKIPDFTPAHYVVESFPVSSYLYVDGGVFELGVVRDATIDITEPYRVFAETFENMAFVGVEPPRV